MSLHQIYPDNVKKWQHISLTGTDHCSSRLNKKTLFQGDIRLTFQYFKKSRKQSRSKGRILEGLCIFFKKLLKSY